MTPPAEGGFGETPAEARARMEEASRQPSAGARAATEAFRTDVLSGLAASPKRLAPKYFYDARGSQLFDDICELPEYYVTRAETSILRASASRLVASWGERVRVVEPGAGSSTKTKLVLEALGRDRCVEYVPVDISREHLADAAHRIRADIPWLRVTPACADFCAELPIPAPAAGVTTIVYFPGSTIGNFEPSEAAQLLARFRQAAGPDGAVVVGFDLKKTPAVLHAAYNDAQGVTAAFNKNLLARMNRELEASFELDAFSHYAFYDPRHGRIEMHLVSARRQEVVVSGKRFHFAEGESIHTECSYKHDLASAERLARAAGLSLADAWLDEERRFAVLELRPA